MLSFEEARQLVISQTKTHATTRRTLTLPVSDAFGYVLAEEIRSDREYPPFDRSTRDGYAVRATEAKQGASLRCVGRDKAGDTVSEPVAPGTCVQIMTGAAVPPGADAVVMIEFTGREDEKVTFDRGTQPGQNFVPRGSEARSGDLALPSGLRLGFAELAVAAQVGATTLRCHKKPRVAILSTGDEVVPITETPGPFQIRNSNTRLALPRKSASRAANPFLSLTRSIAPTTSPRKNRAGPARRYSGLVRRRLHGEVRSRRNRSERHGRGVFFDAVAIRPGKPAVFGRCRDTLGLRSARQSCLHHGHVPTLRRPGHGSPQWRCGSLRFRCFKPP